MFKRYCINDNNLNFVSYARSQGLYLDGRAYAAHRVRNEPEASRDAFQSILEVIRVETGQGNCHWTR